MQFYFLMFTGKEQITPLAGRSPRTGEKKVHFTEYSTHTMKHLCKVIHELSIYKYIEHF